MAEGVRNEELVEKEEVEFTIQEQVHQNLGEIQRLKNDLTQIQEGDWSAYQLQSEIFRRFAIIDRLMEGLSSTNLISTLRNDYVLTAKRDAQSEVADLKRFPIRRAPNNGQVGENEAVLETFAFTELLPECQEHVLDYLKSPQDKLNVLLAMPHEAAHFYFDVIFPILMDHGYLNAYDMWLVGRVSPHFRDVTLEYMKNCLVEDCRPRWLLEKFSGKDDGVIAEIEKTVVDDRTNGRIPDFCRQNPIPVEFPVEIGLRDDTKENQTLEYLQQVGNRLWSLGIFESNMFGYVLNRSEYVIEILRQTPNLQALVLYEYIVKYYDEEDAEEIQLPDLPFLKHLRFEGIGTTIKALVRRYAKTLEYLSICCGSYTTHNPVDDPIFAPNLTTCFLHGTLSFEMIFYPLFQFQGAPLKKISISHLNEPGYPNNVLVHGFLFLLELLSQGCGGTLEDLTIKASDYERISETHGPAACLIGSLKFPKMRKFKLKSFKGSVAFLLQFPKLEELSLIDVEFPRKDVAGLSWKAEELYVSSIWKMLPLLEKVNLLKNQEDRKTEVKTTRSMCINPHLRPHKESASGCILC